jgi:hypothetical protein
MTLKEAARNRLIAQGVVSFLERQPTNVMYNDVTMRLLMESARTDLRLAEDAYVKTLEDELGVELGVENYDF